MRGTIRGQYYRFTVKTKTFEIFHKSQKCKVRLAVGFFIYNEKRYGTVRFFKNEQFDVFTV